MILLRKENDSLNSLIGKSFNQKNKLEAEKILSEIHSKAESRMIGKKSLCYIVNGNVIQGVGGSTLMKDKNGKIVSNLILDQWGKLNTGLFFGSPQGSANINIKDEFGVIRTVRVYGATGFNIPPANGCLHRLGSGTTTPLRTDFEVDTSFGIAPESDNINPTNPVWDSPTGSFKSSSIIQAGGSGTVNESAFKQIMNSLALAQTFTLMRDIISPAQTFVAGDTIILEYTFQL